MKIIFLGTPEFALPTLEKLAQSAFKPAAVFCAPDKPVGRRQVLTPPPVKILAQKYEIPIFQPKNKKELAEQITELEPDLIISAAYGLIVPKEILELPKYGCLNIHPSLLPKYRGPSPIQNAILNGDEKTGVTIFKMDAGVDTGLLIASRELLIAGKKYSTPELSQILAELGAQLLLDILPDWLDGKIKPQAQDNAAATYTKIIKKEDGQIDWRKSAQEIEQQIRAFDPWPGAYTNLKTENARPASLGEAGENVKILKIIKATLSERSYGKQPGELFLTDKNELSVQTGNGCLIIETLQLEGKKPLDAQDFLRGQKDTIGKILA